MENRQSQNVLQNRFNDIKKRYPNTFESAFQILINGFSSIVKHPNEILYRKINLTNQVIQNKLLVIPEILNILKMIGFSQFDSSNQNIYIYRSKSLDILNECIYILNNILSQNVNIQKPQLQTNKQHLQNQGKKNLNNIIINKIPQLQNINMQEKNKINPIQSPENNHLKVQNIENGKPKYFNNNLNKINNNETGRNKVVYFLYDLSEGMVKGLSEVILGKEVEGVWHTAVYVFEREYYYAGGINKSQPRKTKFGKPVKEINFGYTNKTKKEFEDYLRGINSKFSSNNYDLISHNCNHFSDTALYFLTGNHLPEVILKQHKEILKTPLGKQIRPILENLAGITNTQNNNQNQNNPLMIIPFLLGGFLNGDAEQESKNKTDKYHH